MSSRIRLGLALVCALPLLALGTPPKAPASLGIKLFAFEPKALTVAPGQTIAVANGDAIEHTVTFGTPDAKDTPANAAAGATLAANGTATITAPKTPGTYAFYCERHPFMTGTLTVTR